MFARIAQCAHWGALNNLIAIGGGLNKSSGTGIHHCLARLIVEHLKNRNKRDTRKYIVLGFSKGAPDFQVALAQKRGLSSSVAAFISVAGAVGGSPIADALPGHAERWVKQYNLPNC